MTDLPYRRRPGYKRGILLGVSVSTIIYIIYQIVHVVHTTGMIIDHEKGNSFKEAQSFIILVDSAGKKDTMLLKNYNEMNKKKTDSLLQRLK